MASQLVCGYAHVYTNGHSHLYPHRDGHTHPHGDPYIHPNRVTDGYGHANS